MKKSRAALLALALCAAPCVASVAFDAYLVAARQFEFVITVDGRISPWLMVGQSFCGVKVIAFDPAMDRLVIERDGVREQLPLICPPVATTASDSPERSLRNLEGLTLAVELAKRGDSVALDLLRQHEKAELAFAAHESSGTPVVLLEGEIQRIVRRRAAICLAQR